MPAHAPARPCLRRPAAAALAALLLTLGGGSALAQGGGSSGGPGTGVPVSPGPSAQPTPFASGATPAVPMPGGIVEPQATAWDHVTIWPDGRTLSVFYWSGAEACYGLDRVEVTDVEGTLSLTLWTGFREDAANVRCVEIAQLYETVVELEAPLLGGGVPGAVGVQPTAEGEPLLPDAGPYVSVEPQPWDRVDVGPDGTSLWVHVSGGVPECYGIERVTLESTDPVPTLVVHGGMRDLPEGTACVAMLVFHRTPVALEAPLLLGGNV